MGVWGGAPMADTARTNTGMRLRPPVEGGVRLAEHNEKKWSKVVIGRVLSLDKSLLMGVLPIRAGEHLVIKKGFGGFANAPLDTILRTMGVTTCVVAGVTTCVCVSTTIRGGVEHNYRMVLVKDGVAEINRYTHEAELQTMARLFADVKTTDEVVAMLASATTVG